MIIIVANIVPMQLTRVQTYRNFVGEGRVSGKEEDVLVSLSVCSEWTSK